MKSSTTVSRDVLLPAVQRVAALAPSRSTVPILECLKIEAAGCSLGLTASNLETTITEAIDAPDGTPWAGCADARRLLDFVGSLRKGVDVSLTLAEGKLIIAGGGASARFLALPGEDFPHVIPSPDRQPATVPAAALARALRFCLPAAATEALRHYINGVYLDAENISVATDGHMMARCRLPQLDLPERGCLVPLPAVEVLLKVLREGNVTVTASDRLLVIAGDRWVLSSKLIDGTFPDWRRVLPPRENEPLVVDREDFATALQRVADFGTGKSRRVTLHRVGAGNLNISGGETEATVGTTIKAHAGPPDMHVHFNARYLLSALGVLDADMAQVELHTIDFSSWVSARAETEDGTIVMQTRE
jgi:DNA polymerase-3 subunit beta